MGSHIYSLEGIKIMYSTAPFISKKLNKDVFVALPGCFTAGNSHKVPEFLARSWQEQTSGVWASRLTSKCNKSYMGIEQTLQQKEVGFRVCGLLYDLGYFLWLLFPPFFLGY